MFLIWSGNQLQEYADSLERRLANAEVEEETTKHELSELKIQNIVVEEKQKENTNEITKQNKINNNKIIEYEFIIKDMNNIIMQLKNDQKVNYIDNKKDNHFNEENEKTIEEKSFQFLDSIIEVNSFIFYKNSLIILIIIFVNIIIIIIVIIIIIIIIVVIVSLFLLLSLLLLLLLLLLFLIQSWLLLLSLLSLSSLSSLLLLLIIKSLWLPFLLFWIIKFQILMSSHLYYEIYFLWIYFMINFCFMIFFLLSFVCYRDLLCFNFEFK